MSSDQPLESVEVSLAPRERFEEYLQSRGKRVTHQRMFLVDFIFRQHDHFDADELLDRLNGDEEGKKVGRATVYRTLTELVESGLLRRISLSGRTVYEGDYGYPQHDHLHCQVCDRLIEFQISEIEEFRNAVATEHRFRPAGHRFIITGTCFDCRAKRHRQKSPLDLI